MNRVSGAEILAWRRKMISKGGSSASLDWLLDVVGGLNWISLQKIHIDPKLVFTFEKNFTQLEKIWDEHIYKHLPLQYLVGRSLWRDFDLEVSSEVLIPRQETELIVDLALKKFNQDFSGTWADLGTGCGAIALGLSRSFPKSKGHAVEFMPKALQLAQRNFAKLNPNALVEFHLGSWWEPLKPYWGTFDLVVTNPPYIPEGLVKKLDPIVKNNEPLIALTGGPDGLMCIREIILGTFMSLAKGGWIIMEHHYDQSDLILDLMSEIGLVDVSFEKDIEGNKRFAIACHP